MQRGGGAGGKRGGGPHCPSPPQPYSPAPRPCQAGGAQLSQRAPGFSPGSPGKEKSSGEMEWTRYFSSCPGEPWAPRAPRCKRATGKAGGAAPGGSGNSSQAAKNSFALKYKKIYKNQFRNFFFFLKHPKKKKGGGG